MRSRRGLTVLGLVIILIVIVAAAVLLLRMRGGSGEQVPAGAAVAAAADSTRPEGGLAAARLQILEPADSTTAAGDTVTVRVRASSVEGAPVAGAAIHFTVTAGGGQLATAVVVTGDDGVAVAHWALGAAPGAQSLSAAAEGSQAPPAVVTITTAGRPAAAP